MTPKQLDAMPLDDAPRTPRGIEISRQGSGCSPAADHPAERAFGSYAEFCAETYGQHVTAVHTGGGIRATAIEAHLGAGDWSDAPTPDLTVGWIPSRPIGFSVDLGAGRFSGQHRPNDAVLVAPGAGASIQTRGAHLCRALALPYGALVRATGEADSPLPSDGDFGVLHRGLLRDAQLARLLDGVWREMSGGGPNGSLFLDGAILQVAALLLRLRAEGGQPKRRGGLAPWQVRRVADHLEANLDHDVGLAELATLVGLSPNHFCTAFRRSTGQTPAAWLLARRVERAQDMMAANPRLGLTEVALSVGYASQGAFGAAFRRATGMTPGTWRRERLR